MLRASPDTGTKHWTTSAFGAVARRTVPTDWHNMAQVTTRLP
jgi:hypothetical protein